MTEDLIRDILNASDSIDDALSIMTKENRGKTSRAILKNIRDLNDAIALGIWQDLYPSKPMGINKAAQQFFTDRTYKVIGRFDNFNLLQLRHLGVFEKYLPLAVAVNCFDHRAILPDNSHAAGGGCKLKNVQPQCGGIQITPETVQRYRFGHGKNFQRRRSGGHAGNELVFGTGNCC